MATPQKIDLSAGMEPMQQQSGGIDLSAGMEPIAAPAAQRPEQPGFSQRFAEGTPGVQDAVEASQRTPMQNLKEQAKEIPWLVTGAAPLKMLYGMGKNAVQQAYEGGKEVYEEGKNVGKNPSDIVPAAKRTYVSGVEHSLKALPGGKQLWNYGQDVNEGNYSGAAGGATAAMLQAALMHGAGPDGGEILPDEDSLVGRMTSKAQNMVPDGGNLAAKVKAVGKLGLQDAGSHIPVAGRFFRRPSIPDYVKAMGTKAPSVASASPEFVSDDDIIDRVTTGGMQLPRAEDIPHPEYDQPWGGETGATGTVPRTNYNLSDRPNLLSNEEAWARFNSGPPKPYVPSVARVRPQPATPAFPEMIGQGGNEFTNPTPEYRGLGPEPSPAGSAQIPRMAAGAKVRPFVPAEMQYGRPPLTEQMNAAPPAAEFPPQFREQAFDEVMDAREAELAGRNQQFENMQPTLLESIQQNEGRGSLAQQMADKRAALTSDALQQTTKTLSSPMSNKLPAGPWSQYGDLAAQAESDSYESYARTAEEKARQYEGQGDMETANKLRQSAREWRQMKAEHDAQHGLGNPLLRRMSGIAGDD